jgi:DNA-directed RNA polymerase specialized sigma24 family protein
MMSPELSSGPGSFHGGASSQSPVVLFLAAQPVGLPRLELGEECRSIEEKLRAANCHHQLQLRSRWAARPDDLLQALNEDSPSVLHFSGHGSGDQGICFQGNDGGVLHVTSEGLAGVLRAAGTGVSVVLLNACYSESQAEVLRSHIPCVIGLPTTIGDGAAIVYSESFYRALAFGNSVANAHAQGIAALGLPRVDGQMRDVVGSEPAQLASEPKLLNRPGVDPDAIYVVAKAPRTSCTLVIKATVDDFTGEVAARLTEVLRQCTRDFSLRIKDIKKGSVRLLIELSPEALGVLVDLKATNQLEQLIGFDVVDLILPPAEGDVSEGSSTTGERNAEVSSAARSAADTPHTVNASADVAASGTPPSRVDRKREQEALAYARSRQPEAALKLLMVTYGGRLKAFLSRLVSDPARIWHVYQASFRRAARGIGRFRARKYDSVWAWLCQITWETFVQEEQLVAPGGSVVASRAFREPGATGASDVVAERLASPALSMDTDRLEQCLMELPWHLRAQPLMRFSLGLSYTEIGTVMGIDAGTVERNVSQIQVGLRRRMGMKGGGQ